MSPTPDDLYDEMHTEFRSSTPAATPGQNDGADLPPDHRVSRRAFIVGGGALAASVLALRGGTFLTGDGDVRLDPLLGGRFRPTTTPAADGTSRWLGPDLWGNRLQDWRRDGERVECLVGGAGDEVRTVAALTREVVAGDDPGHLRVRTGIAGGAERNGFCGVLLGVGGDDLDHRGAALVQRGSGISGGILCTFGTDGRVRFREHTDEDRPLAFDELQAETRVAADGPHRPTRSDVVNLALDVLPRGDGRFDLDLQVLDPETGRELAAGVRRDVPDSAVRGGLALVSSPPPGEPGARWWFEGLETAGSKIAVDPERSLGPVVGALFSLAEGTLRLTAQLFPLGDSGGRPVRFEYRPVPGGTGGDASGRGEGEAGRPQGVVDGDDGSGDADWRTGPRAAIEDGHVARFRVDDWDATRAWEYRVVYEGERTWTYGGTVPREPGADEQLSLALFSCTKPTARQLEADLGSATLPGTDPPGRYTPGNVYFPHEEVVENVGEHDPDLLVFAGDQLYEENPTRIPDRADPGLDYLYKWYLWLWAFRDLTRDRPSVVLVDDHDVYQPNIWGAGGRKAPGGRFDRGGYTGSAAFVNRVQRTQCGHLPGPADSRQVERGIDVYYVAFTYGGVRFALLEDRKFKSPPPDARDGRPRLLGDRQLSFLRRWAREGGDVPHVCLTQTPFACAQTTPGGAPARDYDSNGYPKRGRDRAVEALAEAGALVLSGDQHLGTLLRHGLETHTDGVVQFAAPQTGATYQRWFEPGDLQDGTGTANTGRFTDAFGNRFRMLAVANPDLPFRRFREHNPGGQVVPERSLRSDGYGVVHVDPNEGTFVVECWPWDADPSAPDAQYAGWPYRLPFEETDGRSGGE